MTLYITYIIVGVREKIYSLLICTQKLLINNTEKQGHFCYQKASISFGNYRSLNVIWGFSILTNNIYVKMIKGEQKQAYVLKTYQIFVKSMHITENVNLIALSNRSGSQYSITPQMVISINKTFKAKTIDFLSENDSKIDKNIQFQVYFKRTPLSKVVFDVELEKLAKQQKNMFRKQLKNKNGYIDYKFVKCTTKILTESDMAQENNKKQLLLNNSSFYNMEKLISELQANQQQIIQKTSIIFNLEKQNREILEQKEKIGKKLNEQLKKIKEGMNIKIKVNNKIEDINPKAQIEISEKIQYLNKIKQLEIINKKLKNQIQDVQIQLSILNELREDNGSYINMQTRQEKSSLNRVSINIQNNQPMLTKNAQIIGYQNQILKSQFNIPFQNLSTLPLQTSISSKNEIKQMNKPIQQSYVFPQFQTAAISFNKGESGGNQINNWNIHTSNETMKQSLLGQYSQLQSLYQKKTQKIIASHQYDSFNKNQLHLQIEIEQQKKQKKALVDQLHKFSKQIKRLRTKIEGFEQQKLNSQREKAKMLSNFVHKLSLGDNEQNVKVIIKEMTHLNNIVAKEKEQLSKKLLQLRSQIEIQQHKSKQAELRYSKLMVKCNKANIEFTDFQKKYAKLKELNAQIGKQISKTTKQTTEIAKKLQQYQKQNKQLKDRFALLQSYEGQLKGSLTIVLQQNKTLKVQKTSLQEKFERIKYLQSINQQLQSNYQKLEEDHNEYKVRIVKLQNDFNHRVKNDDLQNYEQEMDRILVKMFQQVCSFQKSYYQVLQAATKTVLKSQQDYYDKMIVTATTQKQRLQKEKQIKTNELTTKILYYEQRLKEKVETLQVQIKNFQDGVSIIEDKINEMQHFKMGIYDIMIKSPHFSPDFKAKFKPPTSNSIVAKSKVITEDIQILQQQSEQHQQSSQQNEKTNTKKKKTMTNVSVETTSLKKSIGNVDTKTSNIHVSTKFELTKLKHSIGIKKSLLREGVQINSSKLFSSLFQSSDLIQSSKVFEIKKQMSIQRMKIRDRQFKNFRQTSQLIKKLDTSIIDQKIDKDRIIFQHQMRQKDLQFQFGKMVKEYKAKQKQIDNKMTAISQELILQQSQNKILIDENGELRIQIAEATKQVQETSQYLFQLQDERDTLLVEKAKTQSIIAQFEQAEKQLIFQVEKIKQYARINELTLKQHIQERDSCFSSLQVIHKKEVKKMHDIISMLETRITEESQENFAGKSILEKSIQIKDDQIQVLRRKNKEFQAIRENLDNQLQKTIQQRDQLERDAEIFQNTVCELSMEIETRQKQMSSLHLQMKNLQRQNKVWKRIQSEQQQEQQRKHVEVLNSLNKNKTQAKIWEQTYCELQKKQSELMEDNMSQEKTVSSLRTQNKRLNEIIKKRQVAILTLQKKVCEIQIDNQNISLELKRSRKTNEDMQLQIVNLSNEKHKMQIKKPSKDHKKSLIKKFSASRNNFTTLEQDLSSPKQMQSIKINDILGREPNANLDDSEYICEEADSSQEDDARDRRQSIDLLLADKREAVIMNEILTQQNAEFQTIINNTNAKLHREQCLSKDLSRKLQKCEEKINEKQANIQKLISELMTFERERNSLQRENERLRKKLEVVNQCRMSAEVTHAQLLQMKEQIVQKTNIIHLLKERLSESQYYAPISQRTHQQHSKIQRI